MMLTPLFRLSQQEADKLRAVSKAIEIDRGYSFEMRSWAQRSHCGTTCCIFGHMMLLEGKVPIFDGMYAEFFTDGRSTVNFKQWAGKHEAVWKQLFFIYHWDSDLRLHANPVTAAQTAIERFIEKYGPKETIEPVTEQVQECVQL